jgi:cell division protein FtsA
MSQTIYALDLGTTKFCLATKKKQLETVSVTAAGMLRGMLSDFDEAKETLCQLIQTAENEFGDDITKVYVGISGSHLKNYSIEKTVPIPGPEVTEKIRKDLESALISECIYPNREIIHTIPVAYYVDDRLVKNPVGFSADQLKAQYFIVEASKNYLRDMVKLCNQCGLEVVRFVAEPLASAKVSVTGDLKKIGVGVADIGGGTTDGVIYIHNEPVKVFTLNIGGELMTKDLAVGLGLGQDEAEKLKILWGIKFNQDEESIKIEIKNAVNQKIRVDSKQVFEILEPRIDEWAHYLEKEIKPYLGQLSAGLVLTGGGAELLGLSSYLNHILKIHVQKQKPYFDGLSETEEIPTRFATVSGILKMSREEMAKDEASSKRHSRNIFSPVMRWIKDFA